MLHVLCQRCLLHAQGLCSWHAEPACMAAPLLHALVPSMTPAGSGLLFFGSNLVACCAISAYVRRCCRAGGRWAVGVLLYEMLAGYPPWQDGNTYAVYRAVMRCQLAFPHHFDPDAQVALACSAASPLSCDMRAQAAMVCCSAALDRSSCAQL